MALIGPLFLLGLLGIGLPIWLHRLETQVTERSPFATTRFLEPAKKRIHVHKKLKYLLLMALRIAFSLSWPCCSRGRCSSPRRKRRLPRTPPTT
ncbi:MAG: BatA domain-containing protein [Pseudohongiellaceae bacterium]